jgi:(2Fe-2S) ferredoxin
MDLAPARGRRLHVWVCTHDRTAAADRNLPSCGPAGAAAVFDALHAWVAARGAYALIQVTRSGCQGWCNAEGCSVTFWPQGDTWRRVTLDDVPALCERYLRPVLDGSGA